MLPRNAIDRFLSEKSRPGLSIEVPFLSPAPIDVGEKPRGFQSGPRLEQCWVSRSGPPNVSRRRRLHRSSIFSAVSIGFPNGDDRLQETPLAGDQSQVTQIIALADGRQRGPDLLPRVEGRPMLLGLDRASRIGASDVGGLWE